MCALMLCLAGCGPKSEVPDDGTATGTSETSEASETSGDTGVTDASDDTGPEPTGSTTSTTSTTSPLPPDDGGLRPRETGWITVVDALLFPAQVSSLTVGRLEFNGNFANRGDVEVRFDQDSDVISIEMRVYDFTDEAGFLGDETMTPGSADRISVQAFVLGGTPQPPQQLDPADDCLQGAWKDDCEIFAYYDGVSQPVRSGVDLRVHLPKSYRGELKVVTEDNLSEASYPRTGDVIVDGLCGSGDVSLAQGRAEIKLCSELTPTPTCAPELVEQCENFVIDGEDAAWSPACPCPPELFGRLQVESRKPWAADITVDIPNTWLSVLAANQETDKPHACVPLIEKCDPANCSPGGETFASTAEYNHPGPAAPLGAGYNVTAVAAGCGPVEFFASPADWLDFDSEPMSEERGHVRVCADCL